jgi:hypothetical protein
MRGLLRQSRTFVPPALGPSHGEKSKIFISGAEGCTSLDSWMCGVVCYDVMRCDVMSSG